MILCGFNVEETFVLQTKTRVQIFFSLCRKSPSLIPLTVDDSDSEEKKMPALPGESETSKPYCNAATPPLTWGKP